MNKADWKIKIIVTLAVLGVVLFVGFTVPIISVELRWLQSYDTVLFDTPNGDLEAGQYAVSEGTIYFYRPVGSNPMEEQFRVVRVDPEKNASFDTSGKTLVHIIGKTYYHEFIDKSGKKYRVRASEEEYMSLAKEDAPAPQKSIRTTLFSFIPVFSAISFDTAIDSHCDVCHTLTYSHTVGVGSNTVLVVGASVHNNSGNNADLVTSITYNGTPMTEQTNTGTGLGISVAQYTLVAPDTTAHNVVVTGGDVTPTDGLHSSAESYFGVDQSTPVENSNTAIELGDSTNATVTVSGVSATSLLVDHVCAGSTITSEGANQQQRTLENNSVADACDNSGSSEQLGSDGGVMSWTVSVPDHWGISALALKAASLTSPPTAGSVRNRGGLNIKGGGSGSIKFR